MIEKFGVLCPRCHSTVVLAASEEMEPMITHMQGRDSVPCPACGQDMRQRLVRSYGAVKDANRAEKELSKMQDNGTLILY